MRAEICAGLLRAMRRPPPSRRARQATVPGAEAHRAPWRWLRFWWGGGGGLPLRRGGGGAGTCSRRANMWRRRRADHWDICSRSHGRRLRRARSLCAAHSHKRDRIRRAGSARARAWRAHRRRWGSAAIAQAPRRWAAPWAQGRAARPRRVHRERRSAARPHLRPRWAPRWVGWPRRAYGARRAHSDSGRDRRHRRAGRALRPEPTAPAGSAGAIAPPAATRPLPACGGSGPRAADWEIAAARTLRSSAESGPRAVALSWTTMSPEEDSFPLRPAPGAPPPMLSLPLKMPNKPNGRSVSCAQAWYNAGSTPVIAAKMSADAVVTRSAKRAMAILLCWNPGIPYESLRPNCD